MPIPVYLFVGFLDSGKTTFMQSALKDDRFQHHRDRTLLIQCEEGDTELDVSAVQGFVAVETLEREQFTPAVLESLYKQHRAKRVLIEYNGMWPLADLDAAMPRGWEIYQTMMVADAGSFDLYNGNMRHLVADKLAATELVAFNRCTPATDKTVLHRIVRSVSRRTEILYEYTDGHTEIDDIVDPLPFDVSASEIEIADADFGLFFMDAMDNPPKYDGKTVEFCALALRSPKLPATQFVAGRIAVTCCENDANVIGFPTFAPEGTDVQNRTYYRVRGMMRSQRHPVYDDFGPVLYVQSMVETDIPAEEWVYFR